jgi:hypothetical protein
VREYVAGQRGERDAVLIVDETGFEQRRIVELELQRVHYEATLRAACVHRIRLTAAQL